MFINSDCQGLENVNFNNEQNLYSFISEIWLKLKLKLKIKVGKSLISFSEFVGCL
jgi:hypothetical protein